MATLIFEPNIGDNPAAWLSKGGTWATNLFCCCEIPPSGCVNPLSSNPAGTIAVSIKDFPEPAGGPSVCSRLNGITFEIADTYNYNPNNCVHLWSNNTANAIGEDVLLVEWEELPGINRAWYRSNWRCQINLDDPDVPVNAEMRFNGQVSLWNTSAQPRVLIGTLTCFQPIGLPFILGPVPYDSALLFDGTTCTEFEQTFPNPNTNPICPLINLERHGDACI